MFRLSTQKLNGVAGKDGTISSNKILPYIDTSSPCNTIEDSLGEAMLENDLIHPTEYQMTPKLSGLAPACTRQEEEQEQHSLQKDSTLCGLDSSISDILSNLGRIWFLNQYL